MTLYKRFLAALEVTTPELQRLFAEEVGARSRDDLLALKGGDFFPPATWTREQEEIVMKMLAHAIFSKSSKARLMMKMVQASSGNGRVGSSGDDCCGVR